ncbi:nucleotidyl transferase AbiEii/AbiGii toxin family protein [Pedobacter sp. MC2016-14]|uniref:nucleotidyl transferase AbiEii/AbiGii toxin family protein n=1 Tax=Pedobacter sp. MC2016-14 TaxID=2897327 RepID=UPI00351D399E
MDEEDCFALKGGTAINLFYRPLLRLSVDIDLLYIPMDDRPTAIKNIKAALGRTVHSN